MYNAAVALLCSAAGLLRQGRAGQVGGGLGLADQAAAGADVCASDRAEEEEMKLAVTVTGSVWVLVLWWRRGRWWWWWRPLWWRWRISS